MLDKIKKLLSKKTTIVIEEPKIICKKEEKYAEDGINISTNESVSIKNKQDRIPRTDLYRLHYIYIEKSIDSSGYISDEIIDWVYPIFKIPSNMTEKEMFILISYIYKMSQISQKFCIWDSVNETNDQLKKINFEFQSEETIESYIPKELYIIDGNIQLFNKSEYSNNYIEWLQDKIDRKELINISKKYNISLNEKYLEIMTIDSNEIFNHKEERSVKKHIKKHNKQYQKRYI